MILLFCPHCGVLQPPSDPGRDCANCGASTADAIQGDFNPENAEKLLEANFGAFAESDDEIEED